jgi:hypothetical protein
VKAIARVLYGAPAMLLDLRIDQLPKMRPEASVSALLIRTHETRVARHISGKNGGQPAFVRSVVKAVLPNCVGRMVIGSRQLI